MERVRERVPDAVHLGRAAFVEGDHRVLGDAVLGQPAAELDHAEHLAARLLVDLGRARAVVAVTVRDEHRIGALDRLLALGEGRPGEKRVDVDALAAVRVEAERRMSQPSQCGHPNPFRSWTAGA